MFASRSVTYAYDGTLEGFWCCVFESFARKETPFDIRPLDAPQLTLEPPRTIETELDKALQLIEHVFLTFLEQKELYMLRFLQLGFAMGPNVMRHLTDDTVSTLLKAERHLFNESHRYKQFIRFSMSGRVLASVIKPRNQVLPLIAPHFIDRYPEEAFLIYDAEHGMALVYRPGQSAIVPVDSFVMEAPDEEELAYRDLWCEYYEAVAIESRYNPKCRMSHMPKRYWDQMTEFCHSRRPGLKRAGG